MTSLLQLLYSLSFFHFCKNSVYPSLHPSIQPFIEKKNVSPVSQVSGRKFHSGGLCQGPCFLFPEEHWAWCGSGSVAVEACRRWLVREYSVGLRDQRVRTQTCRGRMSLSRRMLQEEARKPTRWEGTQTLWVSTWLLGNCDGWDKTLLDLKLWNTEKGPKRAVI